MPLLLIPEYSGINKDQRIPDRSKTAHRKPPVKCFLTISFPISQARYLKIPLLVLRKVEQGSKSLCSQSMPAEVRMGVAEVQSRKVELPGSTSRTTAQSHYHS